MERILLTSCQAPNADPVCAAIAGYLGERLGIPSEFAGDLPWQERERRLDRGEIHAGWICGLPYVLRAGQADPPVELLAGPVMAGERYGGQPVYFSDVVVRRDSPFHSFAGLRGASWAYNEPHSHSGYNVVRYHLATIGERSGYFGRVVEAGAHQISLQMILAGQVDASAIDSTVLKTELEATPGLAERIRVVETLGPSPIPPWVASTRLSESLRSALRQAMLSMHLDPSGRRILTSGRIARFAPVTDRDYDEIRRMASLAEGVQLI